MAGAWAAHSADVGGLGGQWALAAYLRGRRVDRWERGACSVVLQGRVREVLGRAWGAARRRGAKVSSARFFR